MTLSREMVVPGMLAQYREFATLLDGLSAAEWETASRCAGWRVADVSAHVVGQLTDVVNFRLDGLGSPEATGREVDERRGRGPAELAEELRAGIESATAIAAGLDDAAWAADLPGGSQGTMGFGIEALWFDTYLHADDVLAPLGRPRPPGEALAPSVSHIAQVLGDQGWGPADLALDGIGPFAVAGGGGRSVTGDAYEFVLAATGRSDPSRIGLDPMVNIYR